jgi:hypothetical protein
VALAEIMPDEANSYAGDFRSQTLESINGIKIWGLDDVYKAFKPPFLLSQESTGVDDFYTIKFMGNNRTLLIDAKKARLRHQLILNRYHIPAEARLEETL